MKTNLKPKKCKVCEGDFMPSNSLQVVCSVPCACTYGREKEQKKEAKKRRQEKRDWYKANKSIGTVTKEAQPTFNKFIRLRDHGKPCISCGRHDHEIPEYYTGGKWDCGHYLSVGSHPSLRFHPANAHKQCKSCNSGSYHHVRKGHTVSQDYRERLIEREGLAMVEWLEGPHGETPQNWTREDIEEIKAWYRQQTKELKT